MGTLRNFITGLSSRARIALCLGLTVGALTIGLIVFAISLPKQAQQEITVQAEPWEPYLNAILAVPAWGVSEVCGDTKLGYLVHFNDNMSDEFKNTWFALTKYRFKQLQNGTYVLEYKNAEGISISAPDTKDLTCVKAQPKS